ncbi:glycine-rich domain-containing protein [Nocardia wallacei]|uniref:glycine-rich domain-containing protein n=1 Tax=Nocardia wallacei TaxID=480035 RepID=UPI00245851D0|nr:hypothetical protein [Nocardia wallacei]
MTFPPGAGYNAGEGQAGADGTIPGLSGRTQASITDMLKTRIESNTHWPDLPGMLINIILALVGGAIAAILGGFANVIDAIFGTVNDDYVRDLPTITDHSNSITELQEVINQLILQGNALVFTSNNTYTPSPGIVSIDLIEIGAGAGGAAGRWDVLGANRRAGGGGGGGGEVHTPIQASLLPTDGSGNFLPIPITIGAGGAGGASDAAPGGGGGNTSFGPYIPAGGGNGGIATNTLGAGGGLGGAGMIIGGKGADVGVQNNGGNSISQFTLNGGGGGGGAGLLETASGVPSFGGNGGISPGGAPGQPGQPPSDVVATGGGGGGGSLTVTSSGGAGAFPGGGGGGGGGSIGGPRGLGGNGGNGILFIVERMT